MKTKGKVTGIVSNLVTVQVDGPVAENELCYITLAGTPLLAEVIKVSGDKASVQVFESTRGLKNGDPVEFEGRMLEVTLGPGLLSSVYDGLQNNLTTMESVFLKRGEYTDPLDHKKLWDFTPIAKEGDKVTAADWLGEGKEGWLPHKIMVPFSFKGEYTVKKIAEAGKYNIDMVVAVLTGADGEEAYVTMTQKWPVKVAVKAYQEKPRPQKIMETGVRCIDTFNPIAEGGTGFIPGPSGCGKSTLLRCLAGLEQVQQGHILLEGRDITDLDARQRQIGMVFQQYSLFPNMTVEQNMAFGLKIQRLSKAEINDRITEALAMVGLQDKADAYPAQLSGGQQQRVALARAIVTRPKVLLLDEPLSAIDAKLRKSLQVEIRRIQKQLNITTIFVTHDQDEAMVMSDRICLLNCGKIEQMDTPIAIYTHPRTKFAAGFIGSYNVLEPLEFGRVTGDIDLPAQPIAIRPEVLNIAREKQNLPGTYDIEGTVIDSTPRGNVLRYKVDVNGVQLSADTLFRSFSIYENGSKVWLSLEKRNCLHVEEEAV